MPPKKNNIVVKKENIKKLTLEESSLKSADSDSYDDDDYESDNDVRSSVESEEPTESDLESEKETESVDETGEEEEEEEETVEESEAESETGDDGIDDECLYRKAKVKNLDEDDDDEDLEMVYDDDNVVYNEIVKPEDRITKPFMTVFERVRLLGDRAKQLSLGAKPMIKGLETMNPKEIAKLELEKGVIPLIIERELPNGKKERWYPNELQIIN
jgi:DNA-directed RNA polymerase subunit K/omega